MEYAKVEIGKVKTNKNGGVETKYNYPTGYDPHVLSPIMYQNEHLEIEHCLALVPDNFTFTDKMVKQTLTQAKALIDKWVDSDKDFNPEGEITRDQIKTRKKGHL